MSEISAVVQSACDIAAGRAPADPHAKMLSVMGAHKDYSSRGSCRAHWFRMVLRDGAWGYIATERLPNGTFRAADRRATVYGAGYHGELTITHDRGAGVDTTAHLVVENPDSERGHDLIDCPVQLTRAGLVITLPDGTELAATNPRGRAVR